MARAALLPVFALASLVSLSAPAYAEAPAFSDVGLIASDTGYTLVQWSAPGAVTLDLAHRPDFSDARTLYSGANSAYFLSGLADGTYYLKLRDEAGAASATLELDVAHQSLTRALWLAGLGALVFLAIVATILRGARDE